MFCNHQNAKAKPPMAILAGALLLIAFSFSASPRAGGESRHAVASTAAVPVDPVQAGAHDRFLAVEAWDGDFKVAYQRTVDMSVPPNLINRHDERSQSSGHIRLETTAHANVPWGSYMTWNGQSQVNAAHFGTSEAKTNAFTGSGVTEGRASLPGEAVLTIDPVRGEYEVSFRTNIPLPVVERTWTELHPEIERLAALARSGDPLAGPVGALALDIKDKFPPSTATERQVSAPNGSSDRLPLPASGLVLSGSREYGGTSFSWSLRPVGSFMADAGGPYKVVRGETLQLDGSRSFGEIVDYEWTFTPGPGCSSDAPFKAGALKTGEKQQVVLLCDVQVTLTVRGPDGQEAQDQAHVEVFPRAWRTKSEHSGEEGTLTSGMIDIHAIQTKEGEWTSRKHAGGENVSSRDNRAEAGKLFDPVRDGNNSWEGEGYGIVQVEDPDGPFDGFYYPENYKIELDRKTLINRYLKEDGDSVGRHHGSPINWYQYNVTMGNQAVADAYLASIRFHEREHTRLMEESIGGENDPAISVEEMFHSDRDVLRDEIDRKIRDAERKACLDTLKLHDNPPAGDLEARDLWFPKARGGFVLVTVPGYSITQDQRNEENAACGK